MDSPQGLVVPVVREVQKKSIFEIADDLARLQVSTVSYIHTYIHTYIHSISIHTIIWSLLYVYSLLQ